MVGQAFVLFFSTARNKESHHGGKEHSSSVFVTLKTHYVLLDILEKLKLDQRALRKLTCNQTPSHSVVFYVSSGKHVTGDWFSFSRLTGICQDLLSFNFSL